MVKNEALARIFESNGEPLTPEELARIGKDSEDEPEEEDVELIESDNDGDNVEDEPVKVEEVAEPDVTETVAVEKPTEILSKEVRRIIALKKELKESQEKLALYETEKRKVELRSKHMESSFDETQADALTDVEISQDATKRELELLRFEIKYSPVLAKYPDAREDMDVIMSIARAKPDKTIEQICNGMYGESEPLEVRRNKAAVTGSLPNTSKADYTVSNASTASISKPASATLTPEERTSFSQLKKAGVFAQDATIQEYLKYTRR